MKKCIHLMVFILLFASCGSRKKVISKSFSDQQISKIMSSSGSKPMRVFKINNTKDSILLRTQSAYIKPDPNNKVLKHFTERLFATVRDSLSMGVGIAAPQVGILKNIIWLQRFDKDQVPFEVYLNPKIVNYSQTKQTRREGCLSIPDRTDIVNTRSKEITITYDTMEGQHVTEVITDFTAVIFQHEIDHLYGILYLDHLEEEIKDAN
ncbi:peptide deformylase [Psychroserpens sp. NJDZ02]|uniref:peptide deformylase n=1 Tax=Psychroserpens sp. NJDZ02 TaxID=2570561 RepID=UPI0010A781E6|nr:peptide deformylase [Psychroserpens sp. NJDZ02]QCE40633.1 peptide deformylase [Psychroserpens sp. NJDZ02]